MATTNTAANTNIKDLLDIEIEEYTTEDTSVDFVDYTTHADAEAAFLWELNGTVDHWA